MKTLALDVSNASTISSFSSLPNAQAEQEEAPSKTHSSTSNRPFKLFSCPTLGCFSLPQFRKRNDKLTASSRSYPSCSSTASVDARNYWIFSNRVALPKNPALAGGLTGALNAVKEKDNVVWMGWDGDTIDTIGKTENRSITIDTKDNVTYATFPLTEAEHQQYYYGFSNGTLWPIFHELDGKLFFNGYKPLSKYAGQDYKTYKAVNQLFSEMLQKPQSHSPQSAQPSLAPDDLLWVHDYHLLHFAKACRKKQIDNTIGFFLHTPFPKFEALGKIEPYAKLVKALCHYNVVGFQTPDDLKAFVNCVKRLNKGSIYKKSSGILEAYGRTLKVGCYPIGINPDEIAKVAEDNAKNESITRLIDERCQQRKIIISVDRLDYTKGIPERLKSIEKALKKNPSLSKDAVFLQIAPPSREALPAYSQLKEYVGEKVALINANYSQPTASDLPECSNSTSSSSSIRLDKQSKQSKQSDKRDNDCQADCQAPIQYLNQTYQHEELLPLLRRSHVALVTPVRDGFNLFAAEFVAAQDPEDPGVLILSKHAGIAKHWSKLKSPGAIIVDPNNPKKTGRAIHQALTMSLEKRRKRYQTMMEWLHKNDLSTWYNEFTADLKQHNDEKQNPRA